MNQNKNKQIKLLLLHSHSGGMKCWYYLQRNSLLYGNYTFIIYDMEKYHFTFDDLMDIMPDIIICSDTAGSPSYFTVDEAFALKQFVTKIPCRSLFGTYACFYHVENSLHSVKIFDNRQIAPLFGISDNFLFISSTNETQKVVKTENCSNYLIDTIGNQHVIKGYHKTKVPKCGSWKENGKYVGLLPGTSILYHSDDDTIIVTKYKGENHHALYVSTMPEYSFDDEDDCDIEFIYHLLISLYRDSQSCSLLSFCSLCILDNYIDLYNNLLIQKKLDQFPFHVQVFVLTLLNTQLLFTKDDIKYIDSLHIPFKKFVVL